MKETLIDYRSVTVTATVPEIDLPPEKREHLRRKFAEMEAEMLAKLFPKNPPRLMDRPEPSCGCRGLWHKAGCPVGWGA